MDGYMYKNLKFPRIGIWTNGGNDGFLKLLCGGIGYSLIGLPCFFCQICVSTKCIWRSHGLHMLCKDGRFTPPVTLTTPVKSLVKTELCSYFQNLGESREWTWRKWFSVFLIYGGDLLGSQMVWYDYPSGAHGKWIEMGPPMNQWVICFQMA